MTTAVVAPARAGRRRSQAAIDAVFAAALDLLGAIGYDALTMNAVIERAGVSSATLYRWWPTKRELIVEAVASVGAEPPETDTGSLLGDLEAFLSYVARSVAARREDVIEALTRAVPHHPDLDRALREKFLDPRLAQVGDILRRAHQRGELDDVPAPEVFLSLLVGPVHHRAFALRAPLSPAFLTAVSRFTYQGLIGRAATPGGDLREDSP